MTLAMLINGVKPADLSHAIDANDRGFHYGDGLFETALLETGAVRFLDDHLQRLFGGCERLGIAAPDRAGLMSEIESVTAGLQSGVLKIVVSRGVGTRGYRPAPSPALPRDLCCTGRVPQGFPLVTNAAGAGMRMSGPREGRGERQSQSTRVVAVYALPENPRSHSASLRWCETRLGRNARLAGIKHLNRLEQVLAQAEWHEPEIDEGLMLDTEGELVCGTSSNLFIVRDDVLVTPDLRYCGVRGVMRTQVLRAAAQLGIESREEPLWPHDLDAAKEVFMTNAVRGIRPVAALDSRRWAEGPIVRKLTAALQL